jgi:hypothetical protein
MRAALLRLGLLSVSLVLAEASATATTITVGGTETGDCTFACVQRYQQLYDASIFSGPAIVNSVSFFAFGSSWTGASTWQMSLSTTSKTFGGLSATFANNVGGDAALFDTKTFTGTPNPGDLITFSGSFAYDPSMGNLLVDIIRTAGPGAGVGLVSGNAPPLTDRAWAFFNTTTANGVNEGGYANRTQFELSAVPEPSTGLLVTFGLLGLGGWRRAIA